MGDIVEGFFKNKKLLQKNTHIISNFFNYDKDGFVKGYQSNIIHSFNKNESQLKNHPYNDLIEKRKNVILIGDSLGDSHMIEGLDHNQVIKICFINEDTKNSTEVYCKKYDLLILNDGPMDYVNKLLRDLSKNERTN